MHTLSIAAHHNGLCIAAQRVLQEPRQLALAVRHVAALLAVNQGRDDVTQCCQRQIDLRGLLETLALGACLRLSLRTLLVSTNSLISIDVPPNQRDEACPCGQGPHY
jgi:hypothetical protein